MIIARFVEETVHELFLQKRTATNDATGSVTDEEYLRAQARMCMHDINLALRYCNHFVVMKSGTIYACGGSDIITEQLVYDVYGIHADIVHHKGYAVVMPDE